MSHVVNQVAARYPRHVDRQELWAAGAAGRLAHVQVCANDRGAPGADHVDWVALRDALADAGYGGPLCIESFTAENASIATAASIWRPLARSQDAIATDGLAFCWGLGGHGRLGSELSVNSYTFPVRVRLPGRAVSISAGDSHSCAVLEGGAAYCWGRNQHGQLGTGTTANALTPVPVASGVSFVQITAGGRHTCAVAADGRLFCWGAGGEGQLGTGDTDDQLTPRPVP